MRKKIALLNFPVDNNYGGNLQRFALMKALTDMGYDVTHLSTRLSYTDYRPFIKRIKSYVKFFLGILPETAYPGGLKQYIYKKELKVILPFYEKYVKHTQPIYTYEELCRYQDFDMYVVGSDQVWRRSMNGTFPYSAMFFDFIKQPNKKKIAYGISLGTAKNELSESDLEEVSPLYREFHAVSVREQSALTLFEQYGWTKPVAQVVLDPTLLLDKNVYNDIINDGRTIRPNGDVFCYVLDYTQNNEDTIKQKINEIGGNAYMCALGKNKTSIEQWLRNIRDAKYVITDSYHGVLFSIVFNRPFLFLKNERRGNERVNHIMELLGVKNDCFDWGQINVRLEEECAKSFAFLKESLS